MVALGIVTPWGGAVAPLQERRGRTECARGALQYSPTRPFGKLRNLGRGTPQRPKKALFGNFSLFFSKKFSFQIGRNRPISAGRKMLRKIFGQNPPDKSL
jgi:hypothetical protein